MNDSPTVRIVDEFGHVEVEWPTPRQPFYKVAHEVIEDVVRWRNEYADLVQRGVPGCPHCIKPCRLCGCIPPDTEQPRCDICGHTGCNGCICDGLCQLCHDIEQERWT